ARALSPRERVREARVRARAPDVFVSRALTGAPRFAPRSSLSRREREKHRAYARFLIISHHLLLLISFSNNATVLGFRSAPTDARKTPSAQVTGVRPTASFTSSLAPLSTRNWMMSSEPLFADPMTGVNPIELTAFTSAPFSRHSRTAS